ncbi:hypothetical protein [Hymenobacter metallicola]|uniref:Uncharacterized protein n=1 Tax=Hymenobacter metallicola TaxID=2563114 RepID=A0A4Z0PY61_9BACT|nr:hypothetical protein [Hymenobacter metallicola]TGE22708.1 hypothetical protein E5K02_23545 [Hymenobacter metallicola]
MEQLTEAAFSAALIRLVVGSTVETVKAGPGTGSIFNLHLRTAAGELCHLMVYCAWKLLQAGHVACTWQDAEENLAAALLAHLGEMVVSARVSSGGDMVLSLQSGAELKLFVDSSAQDTPVDEYSSCDYFAQGAESIFSCIRGGFYQEQSKSSD